MGDISEPEGRNVYGRNARNVTVEKGSGSLVFYGHWCVCR